MLVTPPRLPLQLPAQLVLAHLAGEGDAGDVGLHVAVAVLHRLGYQQVLVGVRAQSVQIHLAA